MFGEKASQLFPTKPNILVREKPILYALLLKFILDNVALIEGLMSKSPAVIQHRMGIDVFVVGDLQDQSASGFRDATALLQEPQTIEGMLNDVLGNDRVVLIGGDI